MNKERKVTEENIIVVFERNMKASQLNEILKDFRGEAIVNKDIDIDEHLHLRCNLYVMGNTICDLPFGGYNIRITGDFYCFGKVDCEDIRVNGNLYCANSINASNIKVKENFWCEDSLVIMDTGIAVGGDFECYSIEANEVSVSGTIKVESGIYTTKINAGY